MKVIQYNTNKYGEFVSYEVKKALYMAGPSVAKKVEAYKNTGFWGFGVAITGASCYNLWKMDKEARTAFLKDIYGKDGLNLSVARISIGASDYSAELYTYDDECGDTSLTHFSIERDLEYIIPVIKEIIAINPQIRIFASPWTPPGWMKAGGSACGGHMRDSFVECYAEYFVKFLKAYKEHGIDIVAVTPQNEPETQQFGKMPACIWNPETEVHFVSALKKLLDKEGLDTQIWICDHSFGYCYRVEWQMKTFENFKNDIGGFAFHYYDGGIEETAYLADEYPNLKLHFTEGGPRLYDHYDNDWCKWSTMMLKTLNNRYSSFTGWNLLLDETGGPNIGPFFCGGLATMDRQTKEIINYSGQYKAFKHIAPFVKESSVIYPLDFPKDNRAMFSYPNTGKPFEGCAIENEDGSECLVLVNPNGEKAQIQYEKDGDYYYFEVLPDTVATVVFSKS